MQAERRLWNIDRRGSPERMGRQSPCGRWPSRQRPLARRDCRNHFVSATLEKTLLTAKLCGLAGRRSTRPGPWEPSGDSAGRAAAVAVPASHGVLCVGVVGPLARARPLEALRTGRAAPGRRAGSGGGGHGKRAFQYSCGEADLALAKALGMWRYLLSARWVAGRMPRGCAGRLQRHGAECSGLYQGFSAGKVGWDVRDGGRPSYWTTWRGRVEVLEYIRILSRHGR